MGAYNNYVSSLNPVSFWKLDEASGVSAWDQEGLHHLTIVGTPTAYNAASIIDAETDGCLHLSGSSNSIESGTALSELNEDKQFSFFTVINPDAFSANMAMISHGSQSLGGQQGWNFRIDSGGGSITLQWRSDAHAAYKSLTGTFSFSAGTTYSVGFAGAPSASGGDLTIYVNGESVATTTDFDFDQTITTPDTILGGLSTSGTYQANTYFFNGKMDGPFIVQDILAPSQFAYLHSLVDSASTAPAVHSVLEDNHHDLYDPASDSVSGSFIPTLTTSGTQFTSVTPKASYLAGYFYKLGRLVVAQGQYATDAITVGSASGNLQIGGLPYTVSSAPFSGGAVDIGYSANFSGTNPVSGLLDPGTTHFNLYEKTTATGNSTVLTSADVATGTTSNVVTFTATYFTDD